MDHAEKAMDLFCSGYNCAQSVLLAYKDEIGLDEKTLLRLSAPFGGGCAGLREMCGAVSGMMMVMGFLTASDDYKDNAAKTALYRRLQGMADAFEKENGSRTCAEFLKLPKGYRPDPIPRNEQYYKTRPCIRLVRSAAQIIDRELAKEHKETEMP